MSVEVTTLINETVFVRRPPSVEALRKFIHHRSAQVGLIIFTILVLTAIFAPELAPYDPILPLNNVVRRAAPCIHLFGCPADQPQHIMGIDSNNRDLFSRVIFGSRLSLQIGIATISIAIIIGGLLGAIAGFFGGWLDNLIMRSMDILLAFPALLLAIAIVTVLGNGLINALLAIAIVSIPGYARVVRSSVLAVKGLDYVTASRALGASNLRLIFTRIMPNSLTPLDRPGNAGHCLRNP